MPRTTILLPILGSLGIWVIGYFSPASAQDSAQQLRRQLETNYSQWHRSLLTHDLDAWGRAIAPSRRVMTRNLIISQRQPWPAALFSLPFRPPSLSSLRFLKAEANPAGTAAIAVYFGSVDLGLAPPPGETIPENLFLLHYIKEPETGAWRFDRTRLLSLGPDLTPDGQPGLRKRIARGEERDFLKEPAFRPYAAPPPTPPSVERIPDYVAHLSVSSPGYRTRIKINGGLHDSETIDDATRDIVIGGLKKGKNEIEITTTPLNPIATNEARDKEAMATSGPDQQTPQTSSTPQEVPVGTSGPDHQSPQTPNTPNGPSPQPKFKIEVHVLRDDENLPPATIFTYAPEVPPTTHKAPLWANAVTIK